MFSIMEENENLVSDDFFPEAKIIDDLGIDSVSLLQIIFSLEEHYGIKIQDEDFIFENFETFGNMIQFFRNKAK